MPANNLAKQNILPDLTALKFAKRSFLLISSSVIRLLVQLTVIILFSRELSVNDYGQYQTVWLFVNVTSVISLFGLPSVLLSFSLPDLKQWINNKRRLVVILFLLLNSLALVYIFFYTGGINSFTRFLICLLYFVQNISIIIETLAVKNKKEKHVLVTNVIFSVGYLLSHLIVLYTSYSLQHILTGLIIMYAVKSLLLYQFAKNNTEIYIPVSISTLGKQWLYLGLNDTLSIVFKWLDKWIILYFISITQFAFYINGTYEIPIFGLMLTAVGNIMLVEMSSFKNKDDILVKKVFNNSTLLLASIVFPACCLLFFYSKEIFVLIFSLKYTEAIPVFIISIFVLPLRITNFSAVLQVNHRNDLIVKGAIFDLIAAILLMAAFYPVLHIKGIALAFVCSTYLQAWYYLWHTGKLIQKPISYFFPFKKLFYIMLSSVIVTGGFYYLSGELSTNLKLVSALIISFFLILFLLRINLKQKI